VILSDSGGEDAEMALKSEAEDTLSSKKVMRKRSSSSKR
jgi:hypothetical protein